MCPLIIRVRPGYRGVHGAYPGSIRPVSWGYYLVVGFYGSAVGSVGLALLDGSGQPGCYSCSGLVCFGWLWRVGRKGRRS